MKILTLNPETISNFIIEVSFINTIGKIINGLNKGEFRDCDIKWLDGKLKAYTEIACVALELPKVNAFEENKILNDYTKNQYLKRFSILLEYFKSL